MAGEITFEHHIDAEVAGLLPRDHALAELTARQHGVIARRQLCALHIGRGATARRLQRGSLHLLHPGVYAVGHRRLSPQGRWMAAVLAAGPAAVLSHRSAAALWGLPPAFSGESEVTVPSRRRAGREVVVHCGWLSPAEITEVERIPVTTVSRTLLDLAAVVSRRPLERAIQAAEVRRLGNARSLADLVAGHPRRRGTATLRKILASERFGEGATRSELEERFLAFVESQGLPRPEINSLLELGGRWIECDCLWRTPRVVAELDGRSAHLTRVAFEWDRARDRALQAAGWRVVRVTWRQLARDPAAVAADLRRLLRPPPRGYPRRPR
jgi:hypothetical protein